MDSFTPPRSPRVPLLGPEPRSPRYETFVRNDGVFVYVERSRSPLPRPPLSPPRSASPLRVRPSGTGARLRRARAAARALALAKRAAAAAAASAAREAEWSVLMARFQLEQQCAQRERTAMQAEDKGEKQDYPMTEEELEDLIQ